MTLVKMKEILEQAEAHQYGVGAFSVANMEMLQSAGCMKEEKVNV
jgi:fructose-bisphosphate aldolase class II